VVNALGRGCDPGYDPAAPRSCRCDLRLVHAIEAAYGTDGKERTLDLGQDIASLRELVENPDSRAAGQRLTRWTGRRSALSASSTRTHATTPSLRQRAQRPDSRQAFQRVVERAGEVAGLGFVSPSIRTCCGMPAVTGWRMKAKTPSRFKDGWVVTRASA
jgi:hypothetical protein